MVFRWHRFQGAIATPPGNDLANGPMLFRSVRLRNWHVHSEYVAGTATSIFLIYIEHINLVTGVAIKDFATVMQNVVVAPSGLNPQDNTLSFEDEGFPLPLFNPASNDPTYVIGYFASNAQPTSGFFLFELEFTYDCPYGLKIVPFFVN